jgi:hypothetical protein
MYKVDFVGLVCFFKEPGARRALLPDGRNPENGIEPHFVHLVVQPTKITAAAGPWTIAEVTNGVFDLPPCTIELEGADKPDPASPLDTSQHDGFIPSLQAIDPGFQIDLAKARTAARIPIHRGALRAFRYPGSNAKNADVAVVSELRVPHDGPIDVTVRPDDGSPPLTLTLQPSTEIVIANVSNPLIIFRRGPSHFQLYGQLATGPVAIDNPILNTLGPPRLPSQHVYFAGIGSKAQGADCGNTGCCP